MRLWPFRRSPLTRDVCETCHKPLTERDRVEVVALFTAEDGLPGAVIATYCRRHKP